MSRTENFNADGWGAKTRIGLITPHMDAVPEGEFQALAPDGVSIHAARVPLGWRAGPEPPPIGIEAVKAFAAPPHVDDAVSMLSAVPLGSIAYGFTSSSYILGPKGDNELVKRLEEKSRGIPVAIPCQSVLLAMQALGVHKLSLINPPWFPDELTDMGAKYFRSCGLDMIEAVSATDLATDPLSVTPENLFDWVMNNVAERSECLFLGGGGMRAIGVIEALERKLSIPVLTANQVVFWHALRATGYAEPLDHYGRIFEHRLPA